MGQGDSVFGDAIEDRPKLVKYVDLTEKPENIKVSRGAIENVKHARVVNNVYELLECPVCITRMSPPIYQCRNGHTLCSMCKIRVKSCCPICRVDMGMIRCLALEKISKPLEDCLYECSIPQNSPKLVTHDHKVYTNIGFKFEDNYVQSDLNVIGSSSGMSYIFNCFGRRFCYRFEAFLMGMSRCYIAFLQFMDNKDTQGKNFRYYLKVCGNGRLLSWQGVPKSISENRQKVCESLDGLVIPENLALFFSKGCNQELKLKLLGRVWIEP